MNFIEKLKSAFFKSKINCYHVNSNVRKDGLDEELYKKYLEKKLLMKNITMDRIVKGVLTISIPSDIKGTFNKILIVSE